MPSGAIQYVVYEGEVWSIGRLAQHHSLKVKTLRGRLERSLRKTTAEGKEYPLVRDCDLRPAGSRVGVKTLADHLDCAATRLSQEWLRRAL